jgi:hypothetical protein
VVGAAQCALALHTGSNRRLGIPANYQPVEALARVRERSRNVATPGRPRAPDPRREGGHLPPSAQPPAALAQASRSCWNSVP